MYNTLATIHFLDFIPQKRDLLAKHELRLDEEPKAFTCLSEGRRRDEMKTKKVIVFALLVTLVVSTVACGGGGGEKTPHLR